MTFKVSSDRDLSMALGKNRTSTNWKNSTMKWSALLEKLSDSEDTGETYQTYMKMSKAEQDNIKDVGGFVGGRLKGKKRKASEVDIRSLITLDADFAPKDLWDDFTMLNEYASAIYSTHKHSSRNPRYRIIIPLARDVMPEEYEAIARKVAEDIGLEYFDSTTFQPSRLMYWPSHPKDVKPYFEYQDGPLLDPDEILSRYENWQDRSQWPICQDEKKLQNRASKQQDPLEKEGIIGAFCRAYTIQEAIDTFLSDEYVQCDMKDRYTYTKGSTAAGLVIYEDRFAYSNHATDPASGKLCNAFDLVRLHKFGELDERSKETDDNKLPSYKAMVDFATKDKKVKKELIQSAYDDFDDDVTPEEIEDIEYLVATKNGKLMVNTGLLAEHIRHKYNYMIVRKRACDDNFLYWYEDGYYKPLSANEFKGRIKRLIPKEIRKPNQWEEVYKELITDDVFVRMEQLNREQHLINFKNGVYNTKTGELEAHSPKYKMTIQIPCNYNPDAPKPNVWSGYIDRITDNDEELKKTLQEWFGLIISNYDGYRPKKILVLFSREGNTGKTRYLKMLDYCLGADNFSSRPMQDLSARFGTSAIYGKRALLVDDQRIEAIENTSLMKAISSGGPVEVEFKNKESFSYTFNGAIVITTNGLPYFRDDKGKHVYERMLLIPCKNSLSENERDRNIDMAFRQEIEGVILWALEGLNRLLENDFKVTEGAQSKEATEDFMKEADDLYNYLTEKYEVTGNKKDRVKKTEFEEGYLNEINEDGTNIKKLDKKLIKIRMEGYGMPVIISRGIKYYVGIKYKDSN